jgi:hypothetical protein
MVSVAGFGTGDVVLRRHFMRDVLARVWVGHVAADDEHGLWLWIAGGSLYRDVCAEDGRPFRQVPFPEWGRTPKRLAELTWAGDMLVLHPREGDHSVWFRFRDGGFDSWYVNLERPAVRWRTGSAAGVDTVDFDLDIVVAPDGSWRWKDEDEFTDHLRHPGVYWVDPAEEPAVRAAGEEVVKLIEAGEFPFDGTRCDFRPDPAWPVPRTLPPGWDRPRAYPDTAYET